jgi:hypothetical protein
LETAVNIESNGLNDDHWRATKLAGSCCFRSEAQCHPGERSQRGRPLLSPPESARL